MVRNLWLPKDCLAATFSSQLSSVDKPVRNDVILSTEVAPPHPSTHLSHTVGKEEARVVLNFLKQRHRLEVIFLRLTTKASNEITAEADTYDTQ